MGRNQLNACCRECTTVVYMLDPGLLCAETPLVWTAVFFADFIIAQAVGIGSMLFLLTTSHMNPTVGLFPLLPLSLPQAAPAPVFSSSCWCWGVIHSLKWDHGLTGLRTRSVHAVPSHCWGSEKGSALLKVSELSHTGAVCMLGEVITNFTYFRDTFCVGQPGKVVSSQLDSSRILVSLLF